METTHVTFSKKQVSKDFYEYEYYMAAKPDQEWEVPNVFILEGQILRDFYGVPVVPNSGFRPDDPYGKGSAHDYAGGDRSVKTCKAMDWVTLPTEHGQACKISPDEVISDITNRIKKWINGEHDELIDKLRSIGIDGFGIEAACMHHECGGYGYLDTKKRLAKVHTDKYGKYTVFIWTGWGPNDINKCI